MRLRRCVLIAMLAADPGAAQDPRGLRTHEHGVAEIGIAIAGDQVQLDLRAPGFDIVGFEYPAERAADVAAIEDALAMLRRPLELIGFPEAAGCVASDTNVALEREGEGPAAHSEFHAAYLLTCADGAAIDAVTMALLDIFGSLRRLDVVVIDSSGAQAFEIGRNDPVLHLDRVR